MSQVLNESKVAQQPGGRFCFYTTTKERGGLVVHKATVKEWEEWLVRDSKSGGKLRVVSRNIVRGSLVSTVFLGLDHSHGGSTPVLFETMVFAGEGGGSSEYCRRYSTYEEAKKGHGNLVRFLKGGGDPEDFE